MIYRTSTLITSADWSDKVSGHNKYMSNKTRIRFYEWMLRVGKITEDGAAHNRLKKLKLEHEKTF